MDLQSFQALQAPPKGRRNDCLMDKTTLRLKLSPSITERGKGERQKKKLFIAARVFNVSYFRLSRNAGSVLRGLPYMTSAQKGGWMGQEIPQICGQTGVCCITSYVSKRTHRLVRIWRFVRFVQQNLLL